jgi:hypothetical protein
MLTWLAFYFAFRSSRQSMWRNCAIVGIIAGIVGAYFDWNNMHSDWGQRLHPEYAIAASNNGLMAIAMLLDFLEYFFAALAICGFGWICRWLFIWRKQKEHPPTTPIARSLWRFGNFGWKLVVIVAYPLLVLTIGVGFYYEVLPQLLEKALKPLTATTTATPTATPTTEPKVVDIEKELEKGPIHGSGTFRLGNMDVPYTSVVNGHHGVMQVRMPDGSERTINFDIITYPSGKVIYHYYFSDGSTYDYETTLADIMRDNSTADRTDITTPTSTPHVERALPVFSPTATPHRKHHPSPKGLE